MSGAEFERRFDWLREQFCFAAWMTVQYKPDVIHVSKKCRQVFSDDGEEGDVTLVGGLRMRVIKVSFMEEWAQR